MTNGMFTVIFPKTRKLNERQVTVLANNKAHAHSVALDHLRTEMAMPGLTRIGTIMPVAVTVGMSEKDLPRAVNA